MTGLPVIDFRAIEVWSKAHVVTEEPRCPAVTNPWTPGGDRPAEIAVCNATVAHRIRFSPGVGYVHDRERGSVPKREPRSLPGGPRPRLFDAVEERQLVPGVDVL